jgi:hypothetical protein
MPRESPYKVLDAEIDMQPQGESSSLPCQFLQACGQLFINSAEAAVGKNRHDITTAHLRSGGLHNCVSVGEKPRPAAVALDLGGESRQLEALIFRDRF